MLYTFLYNNIEVRLVPYQGQDTCPETGIAFYVSSDGALGVRVYPKGAKVVSNPKPYKHGKKYDHGKQIYLQFNDAFGRHRTVKVSRAVYMAWSGQPIPPGMTIDHINGITTDNRFENLRCVSGAINSRDGAFLNKLRSKGIQPEYFSKPFLLRFYSRMVEFKRTHTVTEYRNLSHDDLLRLLVAPEFEVDNPRD